MAGPRIVLLITLTLGLLVVFLAAAAQQATHVYRIGRLSSGHPPLDVIPIWRPSGRVYAPSATTRA
jgi:hypothetical protein